MRYFNDTKEVIVTSAQSGMENNVAVEDALAIICWRHI
jgi:hypothetical protein